jgi:hypothetical protein
VKSLRATAYQAYPVCVLSRHEMVNDFIAGDRILVTR